MKSKTTIGLTCAGLALLVAVLAVEPALAQGKTESEVKLGDWITEFAKPLLLAIAGFMGIGALVNQRVGQAFSILIITVVVGAFLYAPDQIEALIETVAGQVLPADDAGKGD